MTPRKLPYSPLSMPKRLGRRPWRSWGGEEAGEEEGKVQGAIKQIAGVRGLQAGQQVSAECA